MITLHSDDESIISDFINNYELNINISESNVYKDLDNISYNSEVKEKGLYGEVDSEPKLVIELISQNIDSNNKYFSLNFERKNLSKSYYISGYPIGFETSTQVVGSVHLGSGYPYMTQYQFKKNWWNLTWDYVYINGANAWIVNAYPNYYNYYNFSSIETHKRMMIIRPDTRESYVNYKVFYSTMSRDAFSKECPLGTYDSNNYGECYYGTVPSGTSAFTYNYGGSTGVWFMYTSLNGTCPWMPESGSGFDGANCKVVQIPPNRVGTEYIWNRNLLIESYRIGEI